jgi:hypothetical protein
MAPCFACIQVKRGLICSRVSREMSRHSTLNYSTACYGHFSARALHNNSAHIINGTLK